MSLQQFKSYQGHSQSIRSVRLGTKSGRLLASGGDDRRVHIWTLGNQNPLATLIGHPHPVHSVAFDISEEIVCAGSSSGVLKLWDLEQGKGHKSLIGFIEFHPYGEFFASASTDNSVKVWDIRRKSCIQSYPVHGSNNSKIKVSPDGRLIVHSNLEHGIKIWDLTAGKEIFSSNLFKSNFTSIDFHPNELTLCVSTLDDMTLLDLESFHVIGEIPFSQGSPLYTVKYSQEGTVKLVSGSQSAIVVTAETDNFQSPVSSIPCSLTDTVDLQWSPNSNQLLAAYSDGLLIHTSLIDFSMLDGGDAQAQPRLMSEVKSRKKSVDPVSESESLVRQMWDMGLKDEVSNTIVSQDHKQNNPENISRNEKEDEMANNITDPEANAPVRSSRRRSSSIVSKKVSQILPVSGNHMIGLEPSAFVDIIKNPSAKFRLQERNLLPMVFSAHNEEEMIESLKSRHFNLLSTVSVRLANIKHLRSLWKASDKNSFIEVLNSMASLNDPVAFVDVLKTVTGKPGLWTLEMFRISLPQISQILLSSVFEEHILVCLDTLKYLMKSFGMVIHETLTMRGEIFHHSIDISMEERYGKCVECNQGLLALFPHLGILKKNLPGLKMLIQDVSQIFEESGLPLQYP